MTKGKTNLIQKDTPKGTIPNNYWPYLSIMRKIATAKIRQGIYYSRLSQGLFPEEQKWFHKETSRTGDLHYIDQHILKECKARRKNLAIA